MRLLLDTHAILWWSLDDPKLPAKARAAIADRASTLYFSIASVWEIAIKFGLGKLPDADLFLADLRKGHAMRGFTELPITSAHAVEAGVAAIDHKDPFDRMLIAQARIEGLTLVSNERLFDRFGIERLWN